MREKDVRIGKLNLIDKESELILDRASELIDGSNLIERLGINNQQEIDYLTATLAWDISRKTEGKFVNSVIDFDYQSPFMIYSQRKGGIWGWAVEQIEKRGELEKQVTAKLLSRREQIISEKQSTINTFDSINRVSNLLSAIYVQAGERTLSSEIFERSEDIITKFRDEMCETRNQNKINL